MEESDRRRRAVAPPEVDWEHLDKKKFLMLGAAVFSVRVEASKRLLAAWEREESRGIDVPAIGRRRQQRKTKTLLISFRSPKKKKKTFFSLSLSLSIPK